MVITSYDAKFFEDQAEGSLRSALAVVPIVLELTRASSVVDFGCGIGTWLKAFLVHGVADVLGLDGPYVDRSRLKVDPSCFRECDLTGPVELGRTYDLATCLEVAEHLPTRTSRALVRALAAASPLVLFSAAVPGQGGTAHVNEQWPEFWERLFSEAGMSRLDVIRPRIHQDTSVEWWYRQNLYLFAADPSRVAADPSTNPKDLDLISPAIFDGYKSFGGLCLEASRAALRGLRNRAARRNWRRQP
jgi:SAM-dependent methyltransferase